MQGRAPAIQPRRLLAVEGRSTDHRCSTSARRKASGGPGPATRRSRPPCGRCGVRQTPMASRASPSPGSASAMAGCRGRRSGRSWSRSSATGRGRWSSTRNSSPESRRGLGYFVDQPSAQLGPPLELSGRASTRRSGKSHATSATQVEERSRDGRHQFLLGLRADSAASRSSRPTRVKPGGKTWPTSEHYFRHGRRRPAGRSAKGEGAGDPPGRAGPERSRWPQDSGVVEETRHARAALPRLHPASRRAARSSSLGGRGDATRAAITCRTQLRSWPPRRRRQRSSQRSIGRSSSGAGGGEGKRIERRPGSTADRRVERLVGAGAPGRGSGGTSASARLELLAT